MDISIFFSIIGILLTIFLGVGGIFYALWYQSLGSPKLVITPIKPEDGVREDRVRLKYIHLLVTNHPGKHRWVPQKTAYSCHGTITFSSVDNKYISNPMQIRWDGNPEPLKEIIVGEKKEYLIERSLMRLSRYIDIPPEEKEQITIALRFYGEDCAYGWTNESYENNYRHPKYVLPQGDYIAHVYITTGDQKFIQDFKFTNPEHYEDFDLISEI